MRVNVRRQPVLLFCLSLVVAACGSGGSTPPPESTDPFGLTLRVAVTALNFPDSQGPASAQIVRAFPNLSFSSPVYLTYAPDGTDRIFVVEVAGRIRVFQNSDSASSTTTFLDISSRVRSGGEEGLLGLAFDPDYASNGYFYVQYTSSVPQRRNVLSRFTVSAGDRNVADASSEVELLGVNQPAGNHNGGMVAFGPDDMLYASFGDGGGQGDTFNNGQDTTNLLSTIIRIDPHGGTPYAIPTDNPFVGQGGIRGEIYAYGLRNPWRFSFDRSTGDLWVGDVGQSSREEVDLVVAGGNYGWPFYEGDAVYRAGQPASNFEAPVRDYPRSDGTSVSGGVIYRGSAAPSLVGSYVHGDYGLGTVWALAYDGLSVTSNTQLGNVSRVCAFGEDRDGEVYAVSFGGSIYRFEPSGGGGGQTPATLSGTGLFQDTTNLIPAPGVIEYDVNSALWSDGARKRRWIALPGNERIDFGPVGPWDFPVGTVLVKHFELDLSPTQVQRLETRVLVHESAGWAGYTYKWNFLQTDADLLPGADSETYTVEDPLAPGGQRQQTWDFPSRAQCMLCHTEAAGRVLGGRTYQLNGDFDYGNATDNQLRSWNHIGLFRVDIGDPAAYEALPDPHDAGQPLAARARSYLDTNCAPCHQPGGPVPIGIDLRYSVPLAGMGLVDVRPNQGDLGLVDAYRIRSGSKESSVAWERMRRLDGTRMPELGTNRVDDPALDLIGTWIDQGPVDK
ncbi:MAG: PQQ-dependent sugar dehydrogenase [Planctomycetota bacterium]|jgi:uncharacterized repeat protein (TIGR03806 family)